MMFAMYLGLVAILAIPSVLKILIYTKKSSPTEAAYKRYIQTIFHTLRWFRYDLKPGTIAWNSLETVRKMHLYASCSASSAKVGIISQIDLSITQFSFMGFAVLFRKELGIQCDNNEMEDFCHFWRVIGHLHGIKDEFNVCCSTLEETEEKLQIIQKEFLLPQLTNPSEAFKEYSKFIISGAQCFDILDYYEPIVFMMKRLIGVTGYHYFESEIPPSFDRKNLKYLKLSYLDRVNLFLSIISRQFMLKICIIRWINNFGTFVAEFFVRYFPFIAIIRFGVRKAYVRI
ncbi:unnamed protein product [Chironomus riparius]|uniref:ER-bound oxygenase mpaB/mpaB'/Rubber oxygenase catalytic domain-containing protein n=1 Tax=Chironomus riparius TaxID=315576 RepID=A0A9N9S1J5_9DIPT|nr:unnamed protein product [Chironomus riparius]